MGLLWCEDSRNKRPHPGFPGLERQHKTPALGLAPCPQTTAGYRCCRFSTSTPSPALRCFSMTGGRGAFCRSGLQEVTTSASSGPRGPG